MISNYYKDCDECCETCECPCDCTENSDSPENNKKNYDYVIRLTKSKIDVLKLTIISIKDQYDFSDKEQDRFIQKRCKQAIESIEKLIEVLQEEIDYQNILIEREDEKNLRKKEGRLDGFF